MMVNGVLTCLFIFLFLQEGITTASEQDDMIHMQLVEGEDLVLTCPAVQNQLASYRWVLVKRGNRRPQVITYGKRVVVGETRFSLALTDLEDWSQEEEIGLQLTLKKIKKHESGVFMCWRRGLKPKPQINVVVLEAGRQIEEQTVTSISAPNSVPFGYSFTVNCTIEPPIYVQVKWLKDGEPIAVNDSSYTYSNSLTDTHLMHKLNVLTLKERGMFSCLIASKPQTRRDVRVGVTVERIVELRSDPQPDDIQYGQELRLFCTASGTASEIVWLRGGTLLPPTPNRVIQQQTLSDGEYLSTLILQPFKKEDNGHYVCYFGGASKGLLINIESRVGQLIGISSAPFIQDSPLVVTCTTQYSRPEEMTVHWLFNGEELTRDFSPFESVVHHEDHNITRHQLVVHYPLPSHQGVYECITKHGEKRVNVTMMELPSIDPPLPSTVEVERGSPLQVVCEVSGLPPPKTTWHRVNDNGSTNPYQEDSILYDKYAEHEDAGVFICEASNPAGKTNSSVKVLVVEPKPRVVFMDTTEVIEGEDLQVVCVVVNWEGFVDFISGHKSLKNDIDNRYSQKMLRIPNLDDSSYHNESAYPEEIKKVFDSFPELKKKLNIESTRPNKFEKTFLSHSLTIKNASVEDIGVLSCNAGPNGYIESVPLIIKARPPYLVSYGASSTEEGGNFTVECIMANLNDDVTFFHNGTEINKLKFLTSRYDVQKEQMKSYNVQHSADKVSRHVLFKDEAKVDDSGTYECVTGDTKYASVSVEVAGQQPSALTLLAEPVQVAGSDLELSCYTLGQISGLEVHFAFDGSKMSGDYKSSVVDSLTSETLLLKHMSLGSNPLIIKHTLTLENITTEQSGEYTCYLFDYEPKSTYVNIFDFKANFSIVDDKQIEWVGSSATLKCFVTGPVFSNMTVEFLLNGEVLNALQNNDDNYNDDETCQLLMRNNLVSVSEEEAKTVQKCIRNGRSYHMSLDFLYPEYSGDWSCGLRWQDQVWISDNSARLSVYEPPRISSMPISPLNVPEKEELELRCEATGFPPPRVTWSALSLPDAVLVEGSQFAELILHEVTEDDVYICSATILDKTDTAKLVMRVEKEEHADMEYTTTYESEEEIEQATIGTTEISTPDYEGFEHEEERVTEEDSYYLQYIEESETEEPLQTTEFLTTSVTPQIDFIPEYEDARTTPYDEILSTTESPVQLYTTQPYTTQPYTPQPYTPQPYNPQPYTPQPYNPQPYNPQPYTTQPYTTQPYTPQPYNPQPYTPQPHNPQPIELECAGYNNISYITWKKGPSPEEEDILFMGPLDLAGVRGISIIRESHLLIKPLAFNVTLPNTFTCYILDNDTWQDIPVASYAVSADGTIKHLFEEPDKKITLPPVLTIVGNTRRSMSIMASILSESGITAVQLDRGEISSKCTDSDPVSWIGHQEVLLYMCDLEWTTVEHIMLKRPLLVVLEYHSVHRDDSTLQSFVPEITLLLHLEQKTYTSHIQADRSLGLQYPQNLQGLSPDEGLQMGLTAALDCLLTQSCTSQHWLS